MDESLEYFSYQNERLALALHPELVADTHHAIKKNIVYDRFADTQDETRQRQFSTLLKDGSANCEEFLKRHNNRIEDEVKMIFGRDVIHRNMLRNIYEKIEDYSTEEEEEEEASTNELIRSHHFLNMKYQDTCPICSGMISRYNSDTTMKKVVVHDRVKYSKKACLSFTTQHKGKLVQIRITTPCPECCDASFHGDVDIETIPCVETEYLEKEKFIEGPKHFIEQCIWSWIDEHLVSTI